ncbi:MAG: DNA-processing protein DprA [Pseudomonadota bacterium]
MSEDQFFAPSAQYELSDRQRLAWLRLIRSENVGPVTFRTLINRFGGAEEALDAMPQLSKRGGARDIRVSSHEDAEQELDAIMQAGAQLVAMGEPGYPRLLRYIDTAPPLLTILGQPLLQDSKCVAIVGSRNASAAGRRMTREIATALGNAGYVVVSGLARGIDAAAHEASLNTGTVAVLAGGINRIYPPENEALLGEISKTGCGLSEMPFNWQATAREFPRRNRIVSGMSIATVVIEAAEKSGSLITARLANEQGREVFALPGSPLDPRASGTNRLIKQGAAMVTDASDILDALAAMPDQPPKLMLASAQEEDLFPFYGEFAEPAQDERTRIIEALGPSPVFIDTLIRETGIAPAQVHAVLLELQLAGKLEHQGGQRVALTAL